VASNRKNRKRWKQWNNDQCNLCKDDVQPETATHLFQCTALTQHALQEEAVTVVQKCLYCLQDQTTVALSLLMHIFQVLSCPPGIPMPLQVIAAQQASGREWTTQGMTSLQWHQLKKYDPSIPSQPVSGPNSFSLSSGRWHGNSGRQEMMLYTTQALQRWISTSKQK